MRCATIMAIMLLAGPVLAQGPGPVPNPFGEGVRTSTNHLTVESRISRATATPGARLTLTLEVTPRRTMHVYAPGKHDYQVVQLTVEPQPWLRAEPTRYPASQTYFFEPLNETVEVFSQPFRLTRELTLLDTPEAKQALAGHPSVTIAGQLEYQACDDKVCYAPAKVPVRFVVTLE
jgi:hypothetical protein